MIQRLPIAHVKRDNDVQPREVLNWDVAEEYAQQMQAGDVFPPVIAFFDGETYWLAAGFHRIEALHSAGFFEIDVDVREGSKRDAILFAVGDNATHGLRRTNADKRRAVLMLLQDEEWGQWSNREIAEKCAVSLDLVNRIRHEPSERIVQIPERTVQRGDSTYTMNTANIGKRVLSPQIEPDERDEEDYRITIAPHPDMDAEDYDHVATADDGLLLLEDPQEITIPTGDVREAAHIIALYMDVTALIDALARTQGG